MKKVRLYEEFNTELNENYEVIFSDGISQMKKFRSEAQALDFMKKEIASNKKLREIAVYKPGMYSTTQTEYVVAFWGDRSYLDNVSKRDPELAAKKLEESVVNEASVLLDTTNPENKALLSFIKKHKITMKDTGVGAGGDFAEYEYTGKRKDLEKMISNFWGDDALAEYIKESAVNEAGMNDPVLMAFRAAKMKREKELANAKPKRKPLYGKQREQAEEALWVISQDLKDLYADRGQLLIDMEQEAEIEGGPVADRYGEQLDMIEDKIASLIKQRNKLEIRLAESIEVSEKKADGTISDDEDARRADLLKRVKEQMEELLASAESDANDIGGSFRAPGIMADIRKELESQIKKFK